MADNYDPYRSGPKNDNLRQTPDEPITGQDKGAGRTRKWFEILRDAMVPGMAGKSLIDKATKQMNDATQK